jgi:hypothetical protein
MGVNDRRLYRKVLLAAAEKAGVKGAKEFINDPNAGLKEVRWLLPPFSSYLGVFVRLKLKGIC